MGLLTAITYEMTILHEGKGSPYSKMFEFIVFGHAAVMAANIK